MGFFKGLTKLIINVAELPVAGVKDVFTLGGNEAVCDNDGSYIKDKLEEIKEDLEDFDN